MKRSRKSAPRLVVIGNGMAGMHCLEQILKYQPDYDVTVFGDETHVNYNRIMLSSVLAGEKELGDITLNPIQWYIEHNIMLRLGIRIAKIDTAAKTVIGEDGSVTDFDKLLIATGSSPFLPPIEGLNKEGVYAFRTIADTQALLARSGAQTKAIVIGGGLLGLEAARGLQVQGCDVKVIHIMDRLMERQLDPIGGGYLKLSMEKLGVQVLLGKSTEAILGNGHVTGIRFKCGLELPADLIVVAAGIRPNVQLGREAGLEVKRGIVVTDHLETSHPDIYAVGECAEHNGTVYGMVAPLFEQGKVLAARMTGNDGPQYVGSTMATKLKIMGVDVFSAGEIDEVASGGEAIRFEDPNEGIYKKLVLRDGRLIGAILVGDVEDSSRYTEWLRSGTDLSALRRRILFPDAPVDSGSSIASMPDSEVICGCMGVTKGTIIHSIHAEGVSNLSQLKVRTKASTGCGSCTGKCQGLLKAVCANFVEEVKQTLCACVPFAEPQLKEIIQSQKLKSVQEVLDIYGNGIGCEICRPALSYLVDMISCGDYDEDRSSRFINDRVHANIQRDGTFSVIPRMRGGVTTPSELRKIADVAEKYHVPLVKVTGSQRIDLLGVRKQDLPGMWADLGMASGQGYTKGVRMVKTCVGSQFCRFGTQDAISAGVELESRLENLFTPHKTKLGVVGCPRNCAEVTVKDIGLIGQEGSWQVVVGGAAGKSVREADVLVTVDSTPEALEAVEIFFQYYRENAHYLERTYDFVPRLGIEKVRRESVYAADSVKQGLLDRLHKAKSLSSDAWLEGINPKTANQFIQIEPLSLMATGANQ